MRKVNTIKLGATKGDKFIKDANDVFTYYISLDFKNYTAKQKPTKIVNIEVNEMDKDGTFKDLFPYPEKQAMTQSQIIEFVKNHKEELNKDYGNFFLFKDKGDFSVAFVDVYGGQPGAYVYPFSNDVVWNATYQHRVFSLQLDPKTLKTKSL